MDSIAFSLTVPPLALKMPNGLDGMSLSPPGARLPLHYLEAELEDPFAFNEEDEELKKGTAVKKKLQSKLAQNRQRQKETEILKVRQEHFSPVPAPLQQQPLQPQQHAHLSPIPTSLKPAVLPQGLVCKSPQPQNTSLPMQGVAPTTHAIAQARQSANKRPLPLLHPTKVHAPDPPRADRILMKATAFSPYSFCRSRLQRLVKLCTQKHQLDADLFPHLGKYRSISAFLLGVNRSVIVCEQTNWRSIGSFHLFIGKNKVIHKGMSQYASSEYTGYSLLFTIYALLFHHKVRNIYPLSWKKKFRGT